MVDSSLLRTLGRNKRRFAALVYRFQETRFAHARLAAGLAAHRRRLNLPVPETCAPLPLYTFVREGDVLRMVPRAGIRGGEGGPQLALSTQAIVGHVTGQIEAIVLRAEGEIDMAGVQMLVDGIAKAFQAASSVILDLSRIDYLDLSGVHVLERTAASNPARFVIVGTRPQVRRVIDLLNLRRTLPLVDSIQAAREYLRQQ